MVQQFAGRPSNGHACDYGARFAFEATYAQALLADMVVERGEGLLLLGDDRSEPLRTGDIIRTPAGDVHGIENIGSEPLVYLAVTTPPQNFAYAYEPIVPGKGS